MKPSGKGSAAYNRKKWNILFIGEDGKVVTVKHFKGIVAGLALLLACLFLAVGVLYYQYQNRTADLEIIRDDMAGVNEENRGLREAKDQMLARLVILESKLKTREEREPSAGFGQSPGKSPPPKDAVAEAVTQGASPEEPKKTPKEADTTVMASSQTQVPPVSIANRNLIVCQETDSEFVRVEYKVMNTGANDTPVAGRSVIVLKGDNMNPEDWIVLPNVPLADLKPSGERGKPFRIYNFRTLKYKISSSAVKGRLETATIFTFTEEGKLLMEREYPLEMSAGMCP